MSEPTLAADQVQDARAWQSELRTIQTWIEDHPILLGGAAILLPSISIYHYATSEGVPLTIASPDIISALPSVLAAIAFLTILLCALPLAPACLMFDGARRRQDGRLRLLSRENGQLRQDFFRWLAAFSLPGVIIAFGVLGNVMWWPDSEWPLFVFIFSGSASFTVIVSRIRRTPVFSESTLFVFGMSGLQMLIATMVMQLALRLVSSSWNDLLIFGLLLLSMAALSFVQIAAVLVIEQTSQKIGFVMQAFIAALCVITFACILPPTGSALAGRILQGSASGNMHCVQLRLVEGTSDFSDLFSGTDSRSTVPLRILSNADGVYLVRNNDAPKGTIYRIPTANVSALISCADTVKAVEPLPPKETP